MDFIFLLLGLAVLVAGAELLVRGASELATALGISPLVIGLTVVAFGTGSPELAIGVQAAFTERADLALGGVIGSNIANVLLILGASALITPLLVSWQLIRFEVPLMIAVSVAVLLMSLDGQIGRIDGLILFVGLVSYTVWAIWQSRKETSEAIAEQVEALGISPAPFSARRVALHVSLVTVGLGMLVLGSHWFAESAQSIALAWGMSELVVGLTIVALGTSMPELATSLLAAVRGERDIAVGNVVGSNLFNLMGVLGATSLLSPTPIRVPDVALQFDLPVMIAVAVACLPIFFTGQIVKRWEGGLFLGYYVLYTLYLILAPTNETGAHLFEIAMLGFVIPLTVVRLGISLVRSIRQHRASRAKGP